MNNQHTIFPFLRDLFSLFKTLSKTIFLIVYLLGSKALATPAENVVLLHGLGRTSASMLILKNRLEQQGYRVISETYQSTDAATDDHVEWLDTILEKCCKDPEGKTHFVTHSLGGIVVRKYLKERDLPGLGRVVSCLPRTKAVS